MEVTTDFKSYHERIQKVLLETSRSVKKVADDYDLSFHRSANDEIAKTLDAQNTHLLRLTNKLLKAASQDTDNKAPTLRKQDDVEDNWRGVVNIIDDLLEKADTSLDEFTGLVKRFSPAPQSGTQTPTKEQDQRTKGHLPRSNDKPQKFFQRKTNNFDTSVFKPILTKKPHAIKPLDDSIGNGDPSYRHPYAQEIEQSAYPSSVYQVATPIPFTAPEQDSAIWVDTIDGLIDMVQELKKATEIAVDLEHHDARTYTGIVCLMQISTRNKDWIIDTLRPWREELQILNQVFTDPKIVKLFHGSSSDIIWLQRDLGLYVVGLFDTYYACEALQFPAKSLKYLLWTFANFDAQKQYQMSDWRIRPLSAEQLEYARSDTHYLLHIYDHVRNLLVQRSKANDNLTDYVLQESKKEALQTYQRFVYDRESGRGAHGWYPLFTQHYINSTPAQFATFVALHEWRDKKARELDESTGFLLPNRLLWPIAENMPINNRELYQCCRPVPRVVQSHTAEVIELIRDAKRQTPSKPTVYEIISDNEAKYGVVRNRWRKQKEQQQQSQLGGVAATLQHLAKNGANSPPDNAVDTAEPVIDRAHHSKLFGTVSAASLRLTLDLRVASMALNSILPLPSVTPDSFVEASGHSPAAVQSPTLRATPSEPVKTPRVPIQKDDTFTLRERSRKRKAEENSDIEPSMVVSNGNTSATNTPGSIDDNEKQLRRAAKVQRKAENQAKKDAKKAAAEVQATATVPFDYAAAPSLLIPVQPQQNNARSNGNNVKPMNPFAKSLDTTTGAKRQKISKERSGKSMTFQS